MCVFVGRAYLFKYGLEHIDIEINDASQLDYKPHGYGIDILSLDKAVVHYAGGHLVRLAALIRGVHPVKLEILAQDAVVKAEVKRLIRLGLCV